MEEFKWPVRVYYEDTDHARVVYYANYLRYMERARTEWLRARGIELDLLSENQGVIFAVRSAHVEYLKPARFNQLLNVGVTPVEHSRTSLTLEQKITHAEGEQQLLCTGRIKLVCLAADSFKPQPVPVTVMTEILGER